jgi:Fe-S oxidoreductase
MSTAGRFPFAQYFGDINVLAALQFKPGEKPYADRPPAGAQSKDLLLYLGCNVLRTAHLAKTAIGVLRAMDFDFNAVGGPAYCCGIIHEMAGETRAGAAVTDTSLRHVAQYRPTTMIMWCPSCNQHFDDVVTARREIEAPYEHMTSFVARHLDRIRFVRRLDKRVALHAHTGHARQDRDAASVRTILRAIPGVQLVEDDGPATPGRHCSAGASGHDPGWPERRAGIMRQAGAARPDVLATIYHSCQRELCEEEARQPFAIVNYISLLGEAMGIEHADDYKRYKTMGDPEAVYEAVREYVEAHALDPVRVRAVLAKAFTPACEGGEGGGR